MRRISKQVIYTYTLRLTTGLTLSILPLASIATRAQAQSIRNSSQQFFFDGIEQIEREIQILNQQQEPTSEDQLTVSEEAPAETDPTADISDLTPENADLDDPIPPNQHQEKGVD
ncbi:MAG: hypothetical protein F6K19_05355 [Cyanothece sp. SIO1E1]|nr:hypothetical protein [Cyanothece sp. SIO1E1]